MLIATWNVNSIRARLPRLLAWLEKRRPDVVCLQELKVADAAFPYADLAQAGYRCAVFGQKTWHGVAILARSEPEEVVRGLDGEGEGENGQARIIAATVEGVRVLSVYAPNGERPGSEKYVFKLEWLSRLCGRLDREGAERPLLLAGDLNIAPEERDVARPQQWEGSVLYNPEMREAFRRLLGCGLEDLGRRLPPGTYSWWDYRLLGFQRGNGLRLDHLLATPALAARCVEVFVDREERKGEFPSDHAPVLARFTSSLGA